MQMRSRRNFLSASGAAALGAVLSGCATPQPAPGPAPAPAPVPAPTPKPLPAPQAFSPFPAIIDASARIDASKAKALKARGVRTVFR